MLRRLVYGLWFTKRVLNIAAFLLGLVILADLFVALVQR